MDYSKVDPQIRSRIEEAVLSYDKDIPVVIWDTEGKLLHGGETLQIISMGDAKVKVGCLTMYGFSRGIFEAGNADEILEAARQSWKQRWNLVN